MSEMIGKALEIAWIAHKGQLDKGGNPYIRHPLAVASAMTTEEEIAVALLHDVIEDSGCMAKALISAGIPENVVEAVKLLTRDEKTDYFDYVRSIKSNTLARKVKLADLRHNSRIERLGRAPTAKDMERMLKYDKAIRILEEET